MEELLKVMKTNFPEEVKDSETYFKMCKEANEMGEDELASFLFEMARDEYTHALFISEFLESQGHMLPPEQKKMWTEYKDKVENMFQ